MQTKSENKTENKKIPFAHELFAWVECVIAAFVIVFLLYTFIAQGMVVHGASMEKTLHQDDKILVSRLFNTYKTGDIVAISTPNLGENDKRIVKRVIATEGQVVDINFETWEVSVDGVVLDEPYVNYIEGVPMRIGSMGTDCFPMTIEEDRVFVLGDNRNASLDSRYSEVGQVDVRYIIGKLALRVLPLNKFGVVKPNAE